MKRLKAQYLYVSFVHAMINQGPGFDSSRMCNELAGIDMAITRSKHFLCFSRVQGELAGKYRK